ncbi:amidohydrolase family protein [Chloroflexota bacterium]
MIIDIHAHFHIEGMPPQAYQERFVKYLASLARKSEEEMRKTIERTYDPTGEKLIQAMDEAGIDKTVIFNYDVGLLKGIGDDKFSIMEQNRFYAKMAAKYPERLIAFVGVDPRRGEAIKILETGVKDWGMKGAKILPWAGFYPNDKNIYPFYARVQELGIPIICHTGPEPVPSYSKYGQPIFLDDVVKDFPGINIIAAHAGGYFAWWPEAAELASGNPNLYIELSTWQNRTRKWPIEEFYKPLRKIINVAGRHKVMFGSDWPALMNYMSQADWVKKFTDIPEEVRQAGIEFTEKEITGILGGNAARVLGLTSSSP